MSFSEVYNILERECGAPCSLREQFEIIATGFDFQRPFEFRFMGNLGFGGKIYRDSRGWYVSCYLEDLTEVTKAMIDRANTALKEVQ